MALEHSCHICGHALARVRAPLDPIYHLPIVVCPVCNTACVRRRHPISAAWRATRRAIATTIGLGWRGFACAVVVGVTLLLSVMLNESLNSVGPLALWQLARAGDLDARWWEDWSRDSGPTIAGVGIAWSIALGAALTTAFFHVRRRWIIWVSFASVSLGSFAIEAATNFAWRARNSPSAASTLVICRENILYFNHHASWIIVGLLIAIAGIPLGRLLRRAFARTDAARWRALLRRARQRRLQA